VDASWSDPPTPRAHTAQRREQENASRKKERRILRPRCQEPQRQQGGMCPWWAWKRPPPGGS
jgi:hypothetical protein